MYSLVALGFVLIYKASACSTSRRAPWCSSAALTYVGLQEKSGRADLGWRSR